MKQRAIIVDLDGTLCDERHRRVYLEVKSWGPREFDKFYEAMDKDKAYDWCRTMVRMYLEKRYHIIFLTGRPEKYRQKTVDWLFTYCGIHPNCDYELYMRPDGDFRQDTDLKPEIYYQKIDGNYDVEFILEDRNKVVHKWREMGLTCLHVAEGDF